MEIVGNHEKSSFSRVINSRARLEWVKERLEGKKGGLSRDNYPKQSWYNKRR